MNMLLSFVIDLLAPPRIPCLTSLFLSIHGNHKTDRRCQRTDGV
jgi:hypothetical protein